MGALQRAHARDAARVERLADDIALGNGIWGFERETQPSPVSLEKVAQRVGAGTAVWGEIRKDHSIALHATAFLPEADASTAGTDLESISPPPPRPECKFIEGEPDEMARELVRLLREEAKVV